MGFRNMKHAQQETLLAKIQVHSMAVKNGSKVISTEYLSCLEIMETQGWRPWEFNTQIPWLSITCYPTLPLGSPERDSSLPFSPHDNLVR